MAFATNQLRRIAHFAAVTDGNRNPGLYLYNTADATATVTGAGYFTDTATPLIEGDAIIVVSSLGGTEAVNLRVVQSVSAVGVVVIA